jgi:lipopolysaccharide cholinephosphotransferase
MGIPYHTPRYMDDIFPLKTMLFEGEEFPVPCRAENVMRIMYGDYMKLPPEDSIATHCERISFND